jgi:peptide-methionine (S)-S-oxide reductase
MSNKEKLSEAMFGAGCFWGVEDIFAKISGVEFTEVGFSGGHTKNPSYKEVCADKTGHAEVVHLKYDPKKVSYEELLNAFWGMHDPTTMNRQGPDVGSQYRSIIFYYSPEQEEKAKQSKKELVESGKYKKSIVTEIVKAGDFFRAEEYHQKYFEKTGRKVCH